MNDRSPSTPRRHASRSRGRSIDPAHRAPATSAESSDEGYRDTTHRTLARLVPYGLIRVL